METVQTAIDGELTRIDRIMEKIDYKKIKELFRIKDTEVYNDRNLTSAVLAVLAIKDVETKAGTQ